MQRRRFIPLLAAAVAPSPAPAPANVRRVTAWTASGSPDALKATVEGRAARVLRVRKPSEEILLLIVLDLTGDLTLVDPARQAAIAGIEKLPASAWAGVLRSQDGLRVLCDPTADREAVSSAIRGAQVSGRAGLLETIEPAAALATALLRKTPIRTALLYITDSNIFNYREDYTNPVINMSDQRDLSRRFPETFIREKAAKLSTALAETDAPVFITHLAFLRDRLNEAYQTGLQQMAEATGGHALFCRALGDIPGVIAQTFEQIASLWAVDVEIPGGTPRNFTVHLAAQGGELQYRTRFILGARSKE